MSVTRLVLDGVIPGCRSLKEKRRVLNSIRDRIGRRTNLAMAELDDQDKWQRTRLLFVAAGSSSQLNRQSLEQIVTLLDEEGQIQIMDAALEELE